jgi:hypothetical protein
MNFPNVSADWALWAALVPGAVAIVSLLYLLFRRSPRGKLRATVKLHRRSIREYQRAMKAHGAARRQVDKLEGRAMKVRPRVIEEARGALADAEALEKIAADRLLVTANHVRRVIFEEFPPTKHARLRCRYLPQDVADDRPFSFDS